LGTNNVSIRVSASNDTDASNNDGSATIAIGEEADLSVGLKAPAAATNGTPFDVSLTASNTSSIEARKVTVTVELPAGVTAANATLNGANCTVQSATITCSLDSPGSGVSVTGTASLVASTDGNALLQARIAGDYVDPSTGNDLATAAISVTSPATARQTASSGGGGGSASWPLLLALLALFGVKNLQRR
jgi:Domain of unknown function DUF11